MVKDCPAHKLELEITIIHKCLWSTHCTTDLSVDVQLMYEISVGMWRLPKNVQDHVL